MGTFHPNHSRILNSMSPPTACRISTAHTMTNTAQGINSQRMPHPRHKLSNQNLPNHKYPTNLLLLFLTNLCQVFPTLCIPFHNQHITNLNSPTTNHHIHNPKCRTADPHTTLFNIYNLVTNPTALYTAINHPKQHP